MDDVLEIVAALQRGTVGCPRCGNENAIVTTPYGFRTCCGECRVRWTRLTSENDWVAEIYSPLKDNRDAKWQ